MSVDKFIVTKDSPNFSTLPNQVLQNVHNLEALGLWCYFQSKPPQWEFHLEVIKKEFNIGRDKLRNILSLLKKHNLIDIIQSKKSDGTFEKIHIHVKDGSEFIPQTDFQSSVPVTPPPATVNQCLVNGDYKEKIINNRKPEKKEKSFYNSSNKRAEQKARNEVKHNWAEKKSGFNDVDAQTTSHKKDDDYQKANEETFKKSLELLPPGIRNKLKSKRGIT